MSLNQVNAEFNDAFETYFPRHNPLTRLAYGASTLGLNWGLRARTKLFGGQVVVNERIVEYPQILRWLRPQGKVLDIGCVSSRLPIQLASMGYHVHGLDVRPYPFTHPNFTFSQADLFRWEPPHLFDSILLVSVIEHFGIGGYGDLKVDEADRQALAKIATWLAPQGQLLVSLPYGKAGITTKHRIYDRARLEAIFGQFEWVEVAYFQRINGAWQRSSAEALQEVASPDLPPNGVAILHLQSRA